MYARDFESVHLSVLRDVREGLMKEFLRDASPPVWFIVSETMYYFSPAPTILLLGILCGVLGARRLRFAIVIPIGFATSTLYSAIAWRWSSEDIPYIAASVALIPIFLVGLRFGAWLRWPKTPSWGLPALFFISAWFASVFFTVLFELHALIPMLVLVFATFTASNARWLRNRIPVDVFMFLDRSLRIDRR